MESFVKSIEIEMSVLVDMIWEGILPAISKQILLEQFVLIRVRLGLEGADGRST